MKQAAYQRVIANVPVIVRLPVVAVIIVSVALLLIRVTFFFFDLGPLKAAMGFKVGSYYLLSRQNFDSLLIDWFVSCAFLVIALATFLSQSRKSEDEKIDVRIASLFNSSHYYKYPEIKDWKIDEVKRRGAFRDTAKITITISDFHTESNSVKAEFRSEITIRNLFKDVDFEGVIRTHIEPDSVEINLRGELTSITTTPLDINNVPLQPPKQHIKHGIAIKRNQPPLVEYTKIDIPKDGSLRFDRIYWVRLKIGDPFWYGTDEAIRHAEIILANGLENKTVHLKKHKDSSVPLEDVDILSESSSSIFEGHLMQADRVLYNISLS